jgi:glutathione S-transferase
LKLHWSPKAPFVRKVLILAHEVGLAHRIEKVRTVVAPNRPNAQLQLDNPLSKTPTLILDDGMPLYDSEVICAYLDSLHGGRKLIPEAPQARWTALRRQALADGMLDILILWRDELIHAADSHLAAMFAAYRTKITASLDQLETEAPSLAATPFDIGHISIGCTLSYLQFRFAHLQWENGRGALADWYQTFAQRASARATEPVDDLAPSKSVT